MRMTKAEILGDIQPDVAKVVAHNTVDYIVDGQRRIRYTNTDVVVFEKTGVRLYTGGFYTQTTKARIEQFSGYRISTNRGHWFVCGVPFHEGILIPYSGAPANKPHGDTKQLEKQLKELLNKDIPAPNNGDCWGCALFESDTCLRQHIEESYMHGTLALRAFKWAGWTDTMISYTFQGIMDQKYANRTIRRYLMAKVIMPLRHA